MGCVGGGRHRLHGELERSSWGGSEWNGESGTQVTLAISAGDAVHGQHHHVDASILGALHHGAIEAAISVEIKLVSLWPSVCPAQFFQTDRAEGGYAEHRPVLCRGGRDGPFASMVEQTLERGRGAIDRHSELLAHHGHGNVEI